MQICFMKLVVGAESDKCQFPGKSTSLENTPAESECCADPPAERLGAGAAPALT